MKLGMRSIEYRRWAPLSSPLSVEFPAELLLELGWADSTGILYGSRSGREIRLSALNTRTDEEQGKVGVFVSRIRGEVFLTDGDLAFLNRERVDLALVVVGRRAGFFVREADGSIQTVRSHDEFLIAREAVPSRLRSRGKPIPRRKWIQAFALAALPSAALALFLEPGAQTSSLEIREIDRQLLISWNPPQNAVLTIEDDGALVSLPVRSDQSSVTYAPRGEEVEVALAGLQSIRASYKSLAANQHK